MTLVLAFFGQGAGFGSFRAFGSKLFVFIKDFCEWGARFGDQRFLFKRTEFIKVCLRLSIFGIQFLLFVIITFSFLLHELLVDLITYEVQPVHEFNSATEIWFNG